MTFHFPDLAAREIPSTNQEHYPDQGSDTSSVWNFCTRFSDVISRGNCRENVGRFLRLLFQLLKIHIKPVPYQKVHQSDSKEKQAQKEEEISSKREWI